MLYYKDFTEVEKKMLLDEFKRYGCAKDLANDILIFTLGEEFSVELEYKTYKAITHYYFKSFETEGYLTFFG